MPTRNYDLHLKGFVGGYDFEADYVDYVLGKNSENTVHVLIDSLGGQVSTALSISSAFHRHGHVHAHFVGMNASAATIASMGAERITMDKSAMYLVHKCSTAFFKWGSLNADDLSTLIGQLEKEKASLDKLDANIAEMYAEKCKKQAADLLELMHVGGWLTAKEAVEWGFVDEITDFEEDFAPALTDEALAFCTAEGIPLPSLPKQESALAKFFQSLTKLITHNSHLHPSKMNKFYKHICDILDKKEVEVDDKNTVSFSTEDVDSIEAAMDAHYEEITKLADKLSEANDKVKDLTAKLDDLGKRPAADTMTVIGTPRADKPKSPIDEYVESHNRARALLKKLP